MEEKVNWCIVGGVIGMIWFAISIPLMIYTGGLTEAEGQSTWIGITGFNMVFSGMFLFIMAMMDSGSGEKTKGLGKGKCTNPVDENYCKHFNNKNCDFVDGRCFWKKQNESHVITKV